MAFTYDGRYLAAAGFGKIRIYDVFGGAAPLSVLTEFSKNVNVIGHDARGRWTFAGGEDKIAKIFDWRSSSHSAQAASGTCHVCFLLSQHLISFPNVRSYCQRLVDLCILIFYALHLLYFY